MEIICLRGRCRREQYSLPDGASVSSEILFLIKLSTLPTFLKALLQSVGTSFGELVIGHEGSYFGVERVATPMLKYELFRHYFVTLVCPSEPVEISEPNRPNPNFQNWNQKCIE